MTTAVLINLKARRGSQRLARTVRSHLPEAPLALTHSLADAHRFIADLHDNQPEVVLSGGGDGTAVSLLNAWDRSRLPTLGLLPLGTGNGWARSTHSPPFAQAIRRVARHRARPWPVKRFSLVEVEGTLSPWAGTGWDAQVLADYHRVMGALPKGAARYVGGFPGYMVSLFGLTVPKMAIAPRTQVRLINLGSDALGVDRAGKVVPVEGGGAGEVLFEGPVSVCGCGTIEEIGLGFRAFPFAHAAKGRMAARVYGDTALRAAFKVRKLWRGEHPFEHDVHFMLDKCRMEFDRPVDFEIGGDIVGQRTSVDFSLAKEHASLLDWSRLAA